MDSRERTFLALDHRKPDRLNRRAQFRSAMCLRGGEWRIRDRQQRHTIRRSDGGAVTIRRDEIARRFSTESDVSYLVTLAKGA